jgi:hypothetical protein
MEPPAAEEPQAEEPAVEETVAPTPVRPFARVIRPSFTLERPEPPRPAARRGRLWLGVALGLMLAALAVTAGWYLGYVRFVWPAPTPPASTAPAQVAPPPAESTISQAAPAETAARVSAQPTAAPATAQQPRVQAPVAQAPPQVVAPPAVQLNPALVVMDLLADSVLAAVRGYGEQRTVFDQGQKDCAALSQALTAVQDRWTAYNTRGKPPGLVLDQQRAARDQSLRAQVDTMQNHFSSAGCPRLP